MQEAAGAAADEQKGNVNQPPSTLFSIDVRLLSFIMFIPVQ